MTRFILFLLMAADLLFCLSFFLVISTYYPNWLGVA